MLKRLHYKPSSLPLKDRLATFAENMRVKAALMKPGREQDQLLRKAGQADTAAHINEWANSPGLRPPT